MRTPKASVLFGLFGKAVPPEFFDQLRARLSLPARGIDSLAVVVWWMMWQRLDGRGSLATAVQQVVQGALGDLVPPEKRVVEKRVSSHTGALSRARTRLPLEAAEAVCDQVFATLIQSAQAGPAVAVVSGGWLLDAPAAHASLREGLSARWQSAWGSALAGDPCADGASLEQWIGGTSLLGADVWGRSGE